MLPPVQHPTSTPVPRSLMAMSLQPGAAVMGSLRWAGVRSLTGRPVQLHNVTRTRPSAGPELAGTAGPSTQDSITSSAAPAYVGREHLVPRPVLPGLQLGGGDGSS